MSEKQSIIQNICYTDLVYERINKKLQTNYSKSEIEGLIDLVLQDTTPENIIRKGKNYYTTNTLCSITITINSIHLELLQ